MALSDRSTVNSELVHSATYSYKGDIVYCVLVYVYYSLILYEVYYRGSYNCSYLNYLPFHITSVANAMSSKMLCPH